MRNRPPAVPALKKKFAPGSSSSRGHSPSTRAFSAAPFGSLYLADLGAEVIKVEDPRSGGDVSRYIPPDILWSAIKSAAQRAEIPS
jgi:hypothetical protein